MAVISGQTNKTRKKYVNPVMTYCVEICLESQNCDSRSPVNLKLAHK